MGGFITLNTEDNYKFRAYVSEPKSNIHGSVIIVQEIFGVNQHIKEVCELYSNNGYFTIAPSLFDRFENDIQLLYDQKGIEKGRKLKELSNETALYEINASISHVKAKGKIGIVEYCWGGSLAWRAACHDDNLSASIIYYGGDVPKLKELKPKCSVMCHFGNLDKSIPIQNVKEFIKSQKEIDVFIYEADHGFNGNHRVQFNKKSYDLALKRSLEFLKKKLS